MFSYKLGAFEVLLSYMSSWRLSFQDPEAEMNPGIFVLSENWIQSILGLFFFDCPFFMMESLENIIVYR